MELSIFKCKIKIDFLFVIILAVVFIINYKNGMSVLLFAVIHELAHLITLIAVGGKPKRINISIFGFGLIYDEKISPLRELAFLVSGFLVNGVLAIIFLIAGNKSFCYINFLLFAINALPIYPLDGGRALMLIVWKLFSYDVSVKVFVTVSVVFYAALLLLSIYLLFSSGVFSLLIVAIYVGLFMINNSF